MSKQTIRLLILGGIYLLTFLIISANLDCPYLWYDEAGQFFISKGLNHDSNPLENEKGLAAVIYNNALYNMDPGGFGILLHYWSKVSGYHIWLRLLPFLFFIGIIISVIYLAYRWFKDLSIALLIGFIPILSPVLMSMGFEIRAYSMESLGAIMGIIALEKLKDKISLKRLFFWGCLLSIFITSRYSEIVIVFAVSLSVLYLILISGFTTAQKVIAVIIYSSPLFLTLTFIYSSALINQTLEPLFYLPYLNKDISPLFRPTDNLLYSCFVLFLVLTLFFRKKLPVLEKYRMLISVTISLNVLFIILSLLGLAPWCPLYNRSIGLFTITLLCFIALAGELLIRIIKQDGTFKYYPIIGILIFTLTLWKKTLTIQDQSNTYRNFAKTDLKNYQHIYVDRWKSPCVRYLFEYGKLKTLKEGIYPNRFTFGKFMAHNLFFKGKISIADFYKTQPRMNDYKNYDLLIAPELFTYSENSDWVLMKGTSDFYIKKDSIPK